MKPLFLLAAAGLSTLVALPHLPSAATIKDELAALHLSSPAQQDQPVADTQIPADAPAADPAAPATMVPDSSDPSTSEPLIAKASPDEVRQSYGEPQSVQRTIYGETWYYPVYIFYFRNGFVHRSHRAACTAPTNTTSTAAPAAAPPAILGSRTQSWRFSTSSSLGTVSLNGAGVRHTSASVPYQTAGVVPTAGSSSVRYSGGTSTSASPSVHVSSSAGVSTSRSSAPTITRTVTAPRSMPAAPSQSYSRTVGY